MNVTTPEVRVLPADPRPVVREHDEHQRLDGGRCQACGHAVALRLPRCPRCAGDVAPAWFGPDGSIWALTVVHVPARAGDAVPYTLAYVDLDAGPRLLAHVEGDGARVGARVRLVATTAAGDPRVRVTS